MVISSSCKTQECREQVAQCFVQRSQEAESFTLGMSKIGSLAGLTYKECVSLSLIECDAYADEGDKNRCWGYLRQCITQREQGADSFKLIKLDGKYARASSFEDCCTSVARMNDDCQAHLIQPDEEDPAQEKTRDGRGFYLGMDVGWEWAQVTYKEPDLRSNFMSGESYRETIALKKYDGNVTRIRIVGHTGDISSETEAPHFFSIGVFFQHSNLQFHQKDLDHLHAFRVGLEPGFAFFLGPLALSVFIPFGINLYKTEDFVPGASKVALDFEPSFMTGFRVELSFRGIVGIFAGMDMVFSSKSVDCGSDGCEIEGKSLSKFFYSPMSLIVGLSFALSLTGR